MLNVIRIAKVVALVAFVLPWAAVSCSVPGQGTIDLATASGIEFVQGKMTPNKDAEKQLGGSISAQMGLPNSTGDTTTTTTDESKVPDTGLSYLTIAGVAVILIGLLMTFVVKGAAASRNALITSLAAAALLFGGMYMWKDAMKKQQPSEGGATASSPLGGPADNPFGATGAGNPFGGAAAAGAGIIDSMLQERLGYWLALGALVVAAGAGGLGMAGGANRQTPPPAA